MEQKPKRRNKQGLSYLQKIGLGIGIIGSFVCISVLALGFYISRPVYLSGEKAFHKIEETLNTSIPDSAQHIHIIYDDWWIDDTFKIRFSLTPDEAGLWLLNNGLCFGELAETDIINFGIGFPYADWWQPENAEYFVTDNCSTGVVYEYSILIDQTDRDLWIIYIQLYVDGL
jgi:hypothetical protein